MTNQNEKPTAQDLVEVVTLFMQADPETQDDVMRILKNEMSIKEAKAKYGLEIPFQ